MDPYRPEPVRCPRCRATLSPTATFCSECGLHVDQQMSGEGPPDRQGKSRSRRPIFIGLAVVVAAIAVGAGFAMLTRPDADPAVASTNSPSPSASAATASAIEAAATPTPTPEPTPIANPILPNRAIADVVVDELNLRVAGNSSADTIGQLRAGARVFVIGPPVADGDMNWYRVAVVSGALAGYKRCPEYGCTNGIGFVATPVSEDPWLEEVEIGCPSSPMTVEDLSALLPLEQLHCFGNGDVVVTGTMSTPCCGYVGSVAYDPAWLARPDAPAYFLGSPSVSVWFRADPASGLEAPMRGDVVRATGHFDDPASPGCRASRDPSVGVDEYDLSNIPTMPEIVLTCRTHIVFSGYEVTGHEDLGPCCGLIPDGALADARRRPEA